MSIVPLSYTPHNVGSPFDALRQTRPDGSHFWSGRDLCPLMGYGRWERFADAIDRAKIAARNSGMEVASHFRASAKNLPGSNGRPGEDVLLTREAAYLVAMNGDPRKREIADAQAYFVARTLQAEGAVPAPRLPQSLAEALRAYADAIELKEQQGRELEASRALVLEQAPKVEAHDRLMSADGSYLIGDVAKVLNVRGMGQNNLFRFLRERGVLIEHGERHNAPKQAHVNAERFVVKVGTRLDGDGDAHTTRTTYVTPKGVAYIRRLLIDAGYDA